MFQEQPVPTLLSPGSGASIKRPPHNLKVNTLDSFFRIATSIRWCITRDAGADMAIVSIVVLHR